MRSPIRVVFDAYHLYHLPQFDPLIDLLERDARFEVILTTSVATDREEQEMARAILERRGSHTVFAETELERARRVRELSPDVFLCGWSRYPLEDFALPTTLVGMIYHGIGVKPSYWRDNHPRLDVRFVEGPYRERQLRQKGVATDLELTGWPKFDPLFDGSLPDRETLLRQLDLDASRKTILYAPTFYPSSIEQFGLSLGEMTREYNLIVKLHSWVHHRPVFAGFDLRPQGILAAKLESHFRHVRLLDPAAWYNIVPLYRAADLLLSDASSTIYEALAVRKPVIVCRFFRLRLSHRLFRHRLYRKRLDRFMTAELERFCHLLDRPSDLPKVLKRSFGAERPNDQLDHFREDMFFHLDGRASERVRDAILRRLASR